MFTGIIEKVGKVNAINKTSSDIKLSIKADELLKNTNLGDSIAINGVCLTVTEINGDIFSADVSNETMQKTTLGNLEINSLVNLEKALSLSTPLGGHLVSGHVDGVGSLLSKESDGNSIRYLFEAPKDIMKFIAIKGSITIAGISLTVNNVNDENNSFEVNIIPHTENLTILSSLDIGNKVNLEVDLIARYLERMINYKENNKLPNNLSIEDIRQKGF